MFGLRRLTQRLVKRHVAGASKRRQSSVKDMYPDRAEAKTRPDFSNPEALEFEPGEDGLMEYITGTLPRRQDMWATIRL